MGPTGESNFQLFVLCFLCHHRASVCSLAYMRLWKLMEVLLKILTVAHSNQCVGVRSEEYGGQRKEGESGGGKRAHPQQVSGCGVGGVGGLWAAMHKEVRKGSQSLVFLCAPTWLLSTRLCWVPGGKHLLRHRSQPGCWAACLLILHNLPSPLWDADIDAFRPICSLTVRQ